MNENPHFEQELLRALGSIRRGMEDIVRAINPPIMGDHGKEIRENINKQEQDQRDERQTQSLEEQNMLIKKQNLWILYTLIATVVITTLSLLFEAYKFFVS